jgi:hypothetical protein
MWLQTPGYSVHSPLFIPHHNGHLPPKGSNKYMHRLSAFFATFVLIYINERLRRLAHEIYSFLICPA